MLVLTRRIDEKVMIGPDIEVVVVRIRGDKVMLGFVAPGLAVHREEVFLAIQRNAKLDNDPPADIR